MTNVTLAPLAPLVFTSKSVVARITDFMLTRFY